MAIDKGTDDYFKKLKTATDFCNGNVDMAKKMISGEYKDNLAIKGRFKDANEQYYGLFFIIINQVLNAKIFVGAIVVEYASIWETKPFIEWKAFVAKLQKEIDYDSFNINHTSRIKNIINKNLTKQTIKKIFELVRVNDIQQLTLFYNKIVSKSLNIDSVDSTVDFEKISSIEVSETLGISPLEIKAGDDSENDSQDNQEKLEKLIQEIKDLEKTYQGKIIKAKTEISPIKGKYIHEIKRGDKLFVIINDNMPIAIEIAKKKGVFSVGQIGSFPADVIVNVKTKNGFMIYAGPIEGAIFKIPEKAGIKINVLNYESSPLLVKNKTEKVDRDKTVFNQPAMNYQDYNQNELKKYKKQDKMTYLLFIVLPLIIIGLVFFIITIIL